MASLQVNNVYTEILVSVAQAPVTVTTASLPGGTVGVAYNQTLAATGGVGGPYTWSVTVGSLPTGLSLSSGGVISGTPSGSPGTSSFTVQATDGSSNSGTQPLSIVIVSGQAANSGSSLSSASATGAGSAVTFTSVCVAHAGMLVVSGFSGTGATVRLELSMDGTNWWPAGFCRITGNGPAYVEAGGTPALYSRLNLVEIDAGTALTVSGTCASV
jgi:hypothetical protein